MAEGVRCGDRYMMDAVGRTVVINAIKLYRAAAPVRPVRCRRKGPSCSAFMLEQIKQYGVVEGGTRGMYYIRNHDLMPEDIQVAFARTELPVKGHPCFSRNDNPPTRLKLGMVGALAVLGIFNTLPKGDTDCCGPVMGEGYCGTRAGGPPETDCCGDSLFKAGHSWGDDAMPDWSCK